MDKYWLQEADTEAVVAVEWLPTDTIAVGNAAGTAVAAGWPFLLVITT